MYIHSFEWDDENEDHIARHGVAIFEVEELILLDRPFFQRAGEEKYLAYGVTEERRYLFIVFVVKSKGRIRVVTARDMTKKEKHYYRKRMGVK